MSERLIDVPIEALAAIDEHSTTVAATPGLVWDALIETLNEFGATRRARRGAVLLGCVETESSGTLPEVGATLPGFVVARAIPPAVLALLGEHRFSRYALIFRILEEPSGLVRLAAESRGEFPRSRGRAYRALVLGSGGHVGITRGILRMVRRKAEYHATMDPAG